MTLLNICLQHQLKKLTTEHQVEPFSREFIFGNDDAYAHLRNQPFAIGSYGRMTLLSAMLRHGLNETTRANLFPSPYQLGSSKSIPQDQLSLVDLAKKVRKDKRAYQTDGGRIWDDPETLKKEFESITSALKGITGTTFAKWEDKQNALRVIYLLDRMMPNSGFPEERGSRFLTFIKTPTTRFSFEARDAYPITESESNTFLLNDLKAYMSIEIDRETRDKIDFTFNSLIDRVDQMRSQLDKAAYSSGRRRAVASDYRTIAALIEAIDVSAHGTTHRPPSRLDVALYLHLNRLEFLHFAGAHKEILAAAQPPSPIASIQTEIVEAMEAVTARPSSYYETTMDAFLLKTFPGLAKQHVDLFLDLIEKALGFRPSKSKYERIISLAYELLYRTRVFGADLFPAEPLRVSFGYIVSALCATSQAIQFTTQYRPRVFGDDSQTRSIITPLETSIEIDGNRSPKEIQEGYLQLWHHRREWVQHALEGTHEIAELKFFLRGMLWEKVIACVEPNDIDMIGERLSELEVRILSARLGGIEA